MAAQQLDLTTLNKTIQCYAETIYRVNGIWEGPDPLTPVVPLFLLQITISIIAVRLGVLALKPFNQPPIIGEILGGVLLGPSVLGRITPFRKVLFPNYGFRVLEPMAHLALVYYAFLAGLKMDIKAILGTRSKALNVGIGASVIPFALGTALYFTYGSSAQGFIYWGSALSTSGFPVLTKILERQQIIHTEIGKTATAAALINELTSWCFLALGFPASGSPRNVHWALLCSIALVLISIYYARPGLRWAVRKAPGGQGYSEFYVCSILTGVAFFGVITDLFGTHPMIGAFMFGLLVPNEALEGALVDKLEDFILGILMPVFFMVCGLRTNIDLIFTNTKLYIVPVIMVVSCAAKILSTLFVSFFTNLPLNEAVAVGILTNAKSVMVMIILEIGQTQTVLGTRSYSLMVVTVVLMTIAVTPAAAFYRPAKNLVPYKRRTIQKAKSDEELRILACIYNMRNVPGIISLLRASNATQRSPISVFALQLVELVGRASATIVVHSTRKAGPRNPSHVEAQTDHIISTFDNFELGSNGVMTQTLTARCAYTTMDQDICSIAKDKHAAFIILPFHKHQTLEGEMEDANPAIRSVNEGVLGEAPCSVGILIERGTHESNCHARNIAMLYFGGPDDREALSYAWRMAENQETCLTVVKFSPGTDMSVEMDIAEAMEKSHVTLHIDSEKEKLLDDDYLNKFKIATANNESIKYRELVLNDEEEAVKAIKSMDEHRHDFYVVGRGRGMLSPLTAGLADWCDCPELGPIGDLLVTSEFESTFSVLVVQQHIRPNMMSKDGSVRSASSDYRQDMDVRPDEVMENDELDGYGSFRKEHKMAAQE